jgi:hypothetical protein
MFTKGMVAEQIINGHVAAASKSSLTSPRIDGELLKLGFEVAQSSVAKYKTMGATQPGMANLRTAHLARDLKGNGLVLVAAGLGTKDNDFLAVGKTTQRHDITP